MKILHSADWHLGAKLHGQSRESEQQAFLDWFLETLARVQPDILLLAGDIFDTATPPVSAQRQYYHFLYQAAQQCDAIVIIAGNHDSAAFLDAPQALLANMQIYVVGQAPQNAAEAVFALETKNGRAIVAAVPFLRERDIRCTQAGESLADKASAIADGVRQYYQQAAEQAQKLRRGSEPLIALGHLFAAGGKTTDHDGVRDLFVGKLGHLSATIFPQCFDYVALGHLHLPQMVAQNPRIRYSGAPLMMGFGESVSEKHIVQLHFHERQLIIDAITVPVWQKLRQLRGRQETVIAEIEALLNDEAAVWLEIIIEEGVFDSALNARLQDLVANTSVKILRIQQPSAQDFVAALSDTRQLYEPQEVFAQRLEKTPFNDVEKAQLTADFLTILQQVHDAH